MQKFLMKLGVVVLFATAGTAHLFGQEQKDPVAFCGELGGLAEAMMTARQAGVLMSKIMAEAANQGELAPIMQKLAVAAYDTPQFSVEENRRDAAVRFRNDFEVECFKGLME